MKDVSELVFSSSVKFYLQKGDETILIDTVTKIEILDDKNMGFVSSLANPNELIPYSTKSHKNFRVEYILKNHMLHSKFFSQNQTNPNSVIIIQQQDNYYGVKMTGYATVEEMNIEASSFINVIISGVIVKIESIDISPKKEALIEIESQIFKDKKYNFLDLDCM